MVKDAIDEFSDRNDIPSHIDQRRVQMLGTSGTVTTLGAISLNLPRYLRSRVDGLDLSFHEIQNISSSLLHMSEEERSSHPCIGINRADLVIAGCAILEALCELWPVGQITIADRGIREGILLNLMRKNP